MRGIIVIAMFVASFADAAWNEYTTVRELNLDASGIENIEIDAGAGSMEVNGVVGHKQVEVVATIVVADSNDDDAFELIEKKMRLSLERSGNRAILVSDFDQGLLDWGSGARIDLVVTVPSGVAVAIDDGSGSIDVVDSGGAVSIDDGSGSITVRGVASLKIDDGSGSIDVFSVAGDVAIVDGSGSIRIRSVAGSVTIDDGSGSINVIDVEQDLLIIDDGSGGFSYADIRGTVTDDS